MSENKLRQPDLIELSDELVADYLAQHPGFFNRHPNLLNTLQVTDKQRGVVSLVERQQQVMRQKQQLLEEEITELMSMAHQNERLFAVYSDLYLQLIDCQSLPAILDQLQAAFADSLSLSGVRLFVEDSSRQPDAHPCIVNADLSELLDTRLANDDYYFGRLTTDETNRIFANQLVHSVVLIKLTHEQTRIGFLAIGSQDAGHFDPDMDTLLISQFRRIVAKLVDKYLPN